MNVHEYQAKALFREYGVSVPEGELATTPGEAAQAARNLGTEVVVVKAQVHAGGRGKGGGVKLAKSPADAEKAASEILGMTLHTPQTPPEGKLVRKVYVEAGSSIARELYLAILLDRAAEKFAIVASTEGGMEIEVVAEDGQCFISGAPPEVEAAVAAVTRIIEEGDGYVPVGYDANGEFGGFDPSRNRGQGADAGGRTGDDWVEEVIPCRSPSAIGRVIGKGGSAVRVIEEETGTNIQVDKRMLECVVSGPPENVRAAVIKCKQIMQEGFGGAGLRVNCTGFEGAIIGPGGKRVRSIAGQSRARVDIEKIGYGESECVIKGAPDAVAVAEAAVLQIIDEETARFGRVPGNDRGAGGWDDVRWGRSTRM